MRAFGHIPDDHDPRDRAASFVGASELPLSATVADFACNILDQRGYSACVGFATSQAIYIAQGVAGISSRILPNPAVVYADARRLKYGRDHVLCDAVDLGCQPRLAWQSLRDGVVSVAQLPLDIARCDEEIPWDARRFAVDRTWLQFSRIDADGWARIDAMRRALAAGHPVCFSTACDDAFKRYGGETAWRRTGPPIGRHYMTATGYMQDGIVAVNSWGADWGLRGFAVIANEQMASLDISDVYVPTIDMSKL